MQKSRETRSENEKTKTENVLLFSSLVADTFPFYKYPYCKFPAEPHPGEPSLSPLFSIETLDGRTIISIERK